MKVAVTGHRPDKLGGYRTPNPIYNSVMEGLDKFLLEHRPDTVITGMALGVDQWMAELCAWNGIPFEAAIPFEDFCSKWPDSSKAHYFDLLRKAERVIIVSPGQYEPWKMQRRNEWMVDNCDRLLAVFDGTSGGTKNCVDYARRIGKPIFGVPYLRPPPPIRVEMPATSTPRRLVIRPATPVPTRPAPPPLPVEERRLSPATETEGMRAARRAAQAALEQEREQARRRRRVEEQRRQREEQQETERQILRVMQRIAEEVEVEQENEAQVARIREEAAAEVTARRVAEAAKAEEKSEKNEVAVRDFGRFVDLDV